MSSNYAKQTTTSLTAPWDRIPGDKIPSKVPALTDDQTQEALQASYVTSLTESYPIVDRVYTDPVYNNQLYCLHSFVPSKGAKPDEHGVFGFMKCRGAFSSLEEANQRAEHVIRNYDSYHEIHTGYVGRPFPIAVDTRKYVQETTEIDIRKHATETISNDVREKREKEKKEIEDIKEREKNLLKQSNEVQKGTFKEDPIDTYTTLQVKKANLVFAYKKTQEKLIEMQTSIRKAFKEIRDMDVEDPTLSKKYYDKYMQARRDANIPDDASEDNWIKYLVEDVKLDFDV